MIFLKNPILIPEIYMGKYFVLKEGDWYVGEK